MVATRQFAGVQCSADHSSALIMGVLCLLKRGKEGGRVTYRWNRLCSNYQVGHIKKLGHLGNDQYTATTTAKTKKDGVDKLNVSPVPAGPTCTQADACIHPPPE
jgi:hypothetical protein